MTSIQFDEIYKGYGIKYREDMGPTLFAHICAPSSAVVLSEIPNATRVEGRAILKSRVMGVIDKDILKTIAALEIKK